MKIYKCFECFTLCYCPTPTIILDNNPNKHSNHTKHNNRNTNNTNNLPTNIKPRRTNNNKPRTNNHNNTPNTNSNTKITWQISNTRNKQDITVPEPFLSKCDHTNSLNFSNYIGVCNKIYEAIFSSSNFTSLDF